MISYTQLTFNYSPGDDRLACILVSSTLSYMIYYSVKKVEFQADYHI